MSDTKPDDTALVQRAIEGDIDAYGEIYSLYIDAIYRYVYYRISNTQEAEDLTEMVFLKGWEALSGYKQKGKPFTSWLYRIAHNVVIDYHRRSKREVVSVDEIPTEKLIDGQTSALQKIIETEQVNTLTEAISQLSSEQQQVIVLRFVEGFSHKEVAEILDKNEGACRMIQYRAISTLSQLMQEEITKNR